MEAVTLCPYCNQYKDAYKFKSDLCDDCGQEYQKQQQQAIDLVNKALKNQEITRGTSCALCDRHLGEQVKRIVAHHWQGYDHPLSIWWLCNSCNSKLRGYRFHNGSISIDEARELIKSSQWSQKRKIDKYI